MIPATRRSRSTVRPSRFSDDSSPPRRRTRWAARQNSLAMHRLSWETGRLDSAGLSVLPRLPTVGLARCAKRFLMPMRSLAATRSRFASAAPVRTRSTSSRCCQRLSIRSSSTARRSSARVATQAVQKKPRNAQLKIELNGANAGAGAHGLNITAGDSTVRGLVINRFSGSGIRIAVNDGNKIECNFLGTDLTGMYGTRQPVGRRDHSGLAQSRGWRLDCGGAKRNLGQRPERRVDLRSRFDVQHGFRKLHRHERCRYRRDREQNWRASRGCHV